MKTGIFKATKAVFLLVVLSSTQTFAIASQEQESYENCIARVAEELVKDKTGKYLPWNVIKENPQETRKATAANFCTSRVYKPNKLNRTSDSGRRYEQRADLTPVEASVAR